jgi:hypothetical protein
LPPTNVPLPTADNPFATTNYDRLIVPCYTLGEYLSVSSKDDRLYTLWGDDRRSIRQPVSPLDPISGLTHRQEDVFFQALSLVAGAALPSIAGAAPQVQVTTAPDR